MSEVKQSNGILVTAIRYKNPVGKQFKLDENGALEKIPPGIRSDFARAIAREFATPAEYFAWADTLDVNTMQVAGTFPKNADGQTVRLSTTAGEGELAATKECLEFRDQPGILRIDADYKEPSEVAGIYPEDPRRFASHIEFKAFLIEMAPRLAGAALRITDSSSSRLQIDGVDVTGIRGLHAELAVSDASKIPSILAAMHQKAWAKGYGWAFVSKAGAIHERSPVDLAMDRPTQPFFGGAAILDARITSGAQTTLIPGEVISSDLLLFDLALSPLEKNEASLAFSKATNELASVAAAVKHAKADQLAPAYAARADISVMKAKEAILQGFGGVLPPSFEIVTTAGKVITAGDLWDRKYDGTTVKYPLEPAYVATTYVRYDSAGRPMLYSFAHGRHILGIEPLPWTAPAALDAILKEVGKVAGHPNLELLIDRPALAAELQRVVRSRSEKTTLYRLHQRAEDGIFVVNTFTAAEYFGEIFDPSDYIIENNLPSVSRGLNVTRWLGEERLSVKERAAVHKIMATFWARIASALTDGVRRYWREERQVDMLNYRVDMFAKTGSFVVEQRGSLVTATLVQPHKPFDVEKYAHVTQAKMDEVLFDYKEHFQLFDQLLQLIVAARFASDGREAFFWMQAVSSFGKNFLADGIFGRGLDNGGLGISMPLNLDQISAALKGTPSPISPEEYAAAWILFCDEFKAVDGSLKTINNTLRVAPKNRMQGEIRLYLKWFASDEDAPSLSQGGVDRQLVNRFSYWKLESGKLTSRPLFQRSNQTYLAALRKYTAGKLNGSVEEYQKLGPQAASDRADNELRAFHKKFNISAQFGALDDELPIVADEFRDEVKRLVNKGLEYIEHDRDVAKLKSDIVYGTKSAKGGPEIIVLKHPEVHIESYLQRTRGRSELAKYKARKTDLINLIGQRTANGPERIYTLSGVISCRGLIIVPGED